MRNFILLLLLLSFGLTQVNGQKDSAARKSIFNKIADVIQPSVNKSIINTVNIEPDPTSIFGYCAWTDPVTERKHLPMGHNRTTGEWVYVLGYPRFTLQFVHRTQQDGYGNPLREQRIYGNAGPFLHTVDSDGNLTSDRQNIAGYKYRFIFNFDRNYAGNPIGDINGTIRYNPDLWRFEDIILHEWSQPDAYDMPVEDFPVFPVRWTKRKYPFPGLPDF